MDPRDPRAQPVPPPPPGRRVRLRAWLRRRDRQGHRPVLLLAAGLVGFVVAGLLSVFAAVLLQPRFTALELSAQRLAPDDPTAQPPVEQVAPFSAFDRRYVVDVATPPGGAGPLVARARAERWQVVPVAGPADTTVLRRDGIEARLAVGPDVTRITTRIADAVRERQRAGVVAGAVAGLLAGIGWVLVQLRGNPRLRAA